MDDLAPLQSLVDAWYEDFTRRFPARITATGMLRIYLLQLLYLLDGTKQQQFARGPGGQPVFRLSEVAHALGSSRQSVIATALQSTLACPHLVWEHFGTGAPAEPGLTLGGVVILTALISPWRFRTHERQQWQKQRHELAMNIIRAMPADEPDVGAQINRLVVCMLH